MILTGKEIKKQVGLGNITIEPFIEENINPNSYNYRIGCYYTVVDTNHSINRDYSKVETLKIPTNGLLLKTSTVYLSNTEEIIGSNKFVPILIGRSSIGRLGLFLELSADLGNLGPSHKWTLELTCVQPVKIYPYMKIGQVSFWVPKGDISEYSGKYVNHNLPTHNLYISNLLGDE